MATLSSLSVKIELDEVNGHIVFTDLIGNDYNTVYGYTLTDLLGLIKISDSQARVIYKNSGWDSDNYSSPDITSSSWNKTISTAVPIGQDTLIVRQFYTIEYKISVDIGVSTFLSFLQVFQNLYNRAAVSVTAVSSLKDSTLIFTDNTNYTLTLNQNNYVPTSQSRTFDITWPVGSYQPNTTSSSATVQLGPDIWSGQYETNLSVDLAYLFINNVNGLTITVTDTITYTMNRVVVVYQDFTGLVNQALLQLTATYENYKAYNLPYAQNYQELLDDIMMYYDMFKMAYLTNQDMSYAMTQIYDILSNPELGLSITLTVAEILPNQSPPIPSGQITVPAYYVAQTNNVSTFNIPELAGGTPILAMRGTDVMYQGTGQDYTYDITTGDVTMVSGKELGIYEKVYFLITKTT